MSWNTINDYRNLKPKEKKPRKPSKFGNDKWKALETNNTPCSTTTTSNPSSTL